MDVGVCLHMSKWSCAGGVQVKLHSVFSKGVLHFNHTDEVHRTVLAEKP